MRTPTLRTSCQIFTRPAPKAKIINIAKEHVASSGRAEWGGRSRVQPIPSKRSAGSSQSGFFEVQIVRIELADFYQPWPVLNDQFSILKVDNA
jgi:hypothetical protein